MKSCTRYCDVIFMWWHLVVLCSAVTGEAAEIGVVHTAPPETQSQGKMVLRQNADGNKADKNFALL